jgi:hypothetical protein
MFRIRELLAHHLLLDPFWPFPSFDPTFAFEGTLPIQSVNLCLSDFRIWSTDLALAHDLSIYMCTVRLGRRPPNGRLTS